MSKITFDSLANGAMQERFNDALHDVLQNIIDPNTEAKKARKIVLTLSLNPNEERDLASVNFSVKTTLIEPKSIGTEIIIDRDTSGQAVAAEVQKTLPGQMTIESYIGANANVVPIAK